MNAADALPDPHAAIWAFSWATDLVGATFRSSTQVGSNEANQVFRLDTDDEGLFLKVGPDLGREYLRLRWLEGRLSAPRPLGFTSRDGMDALLTSAVEGDGLAGLSASLPPQAVVERLAAALKTVHGTDTTDWPFGGTGAVLVHGDACLPNFLFVGERLSGCIDVGDMALGEPEVDLAAAVWSLQYNMGPGHGLALLREYGVMDADEKYVERLRRNYETQCP